MNEDRHIWRDWARFLHRWGMSEWTASFLEAAGPLNLLGAQLVYLGQPILSSAMSDDHLNALTRVLEDSSCTQDFVLYLREVRLS